MMKSRFETTLLYSFRTEFEFEFQIIPEATQDPTLTSFRKTSFFARQRGGLTQRMTDAHLFMTRHIDLAQKASSILLQLCQVTPSSDSYVSLLNSNIDLNGHLVRDLLVI